MACGALGRQHCSFIPFLAVGSLIGTQEEQTQVQANPRLKDIRGLWDALVWWCCTVLVSADVLFAQPAVKEDTKDDAPDIDPNRK